MVNRHYFFEHPVICGVIPVENQKFIDKLNEIELKNRQKISENPPIYVKSIEKDGTVVLSGCTKYNSDIL